MIDERLGLHATQKEATSDMMTDNYILIMIRTHGVERRTGRRLWAGSVAEIETPTTFQNIPSSWVLQSPKSQLH